jgi:high-affinity Fe2+/Pb2+ permease
MNHVQTAKLLRRFVGASSALCGLIGGGLLGLVLFILFRGFNFYQDLFLAAMLLVAYGFFRAGKWLDGVHDHCTAVIDQQEAKK